MRSRKTHASDDPLSVIDESLLYDDFDEERFLKSVEHLDETAKRICGRHGAALWARREIPQKSYRPAQRGG